MAFTDKNFIKYFYENGSHVSYQELMYKAKRIYQSRVMTNQWNSIIQEHEDIVAIKAQLDAFSDIKIKRERKQRKL
jgi:hypothetical protein